MRNAGLKEAQAGIKIARRNINNLRYADDTTLMAESEFSSVIQSCPTLCDPRDGNPPGSPIPGILQVRILEWVAISFSNAWKWKVKVKLLSCAWLLATPWTAAYQAPLSMGFSRQEYWSGLPLPSLFSRSSPNIKFLHMPVDSLSHSPDKVAQTQDSPISGGTRQREKTISVLPGEV